MLKLAVASLLLAGACAAQTVIDVEPVKEIKPTGTLATCGYKPSAGESPFFKKLEPEEMTNGGMLSQYSIHKKTGRSIAWFGVVRGITPVSGEPNTYDLLMQHNYFDGLSDCHIMMVSWSGGGDFVVRVKTDGQTSIPSLALLRIYGKVTDEKNDLPQVEAEYVRVWPWFTFTFTDLGSEDHTNKRWLQSCKACKGGRIYNPFPTQEYYTRMLGDPSEFGVKLKQ